MKCDCRKGDERIEVHGGFSVCINCGTEFGVYLSAAYSANNSELYRNKFYRQPYCRANRFSRLVKRVCGMGPRIPDELIHFCIDRNPTNYKHVQYLVKIFRRETGSRPVGYAQIPSLYRIVMGDSNGLPILCPSEIQFVVGVFRELDYYSRHACQKKFAYNFILRAIFTLPHVQKKLGKERSLSIRDLIKPLSCQRRSALYHKNLKVLLDKKIFQ